MNALSPAAKGGTETTAIVHSDNLTTDPRKGRTSVFQCNFKNSFQLPVQVQRMIGWHIPHNTPMLLRKPFKAFLLFPSLVKQG
jgi:hypothetical protein